MHRAAEAQWTLKWTPKSGNQWEEACVSCLCPVKHQICVQPACAQSNERSSANSTHTNMLSLIKTQTIPTLSTHISYYIKTIVYSLTHFSHHSCRDDSCFWSLFALDFTLIDPKRQWKSWGGILFLFSVGFSLWLGTIWNVKMHSRWQVA